MTQTRAEITRAIIQEVADRYGVTVEQILSRHGPRSLLAARVEIAQRLAARGYYGNQIAAALDRDWTTVYFYLGRTIQKPSQHSLAKAKPPPPAPEEPPPRPLIHYAGWEPPHRPRGKKATKRPQPPRE